MKEWSAMSETDHPVKLLLIQFVAARLSARGIETSEPRQAGQESSARPSAASLHEVDTSFPMHLWGSNVPGRSPNKLKHGLERDSPFHQEAYDDLDELDPRRKGKRT